MALKNDMQVKAAKLPKGKKSVKYSVSEGLYLFINKSGKYWRYSYKYAGKRKDASLGIYKPDSQKHVSLKEAKSKAQVVKNLLKDGIDPNQQKKNEKKNMMRQMNEQQSERASNENTFEKVGREWFELNQDKWKYSHSKKQLRRLEMHLYPSIGHVPIANLKRMEVVGALRVIKSPDIAKRVSQMCRCIFDYACNMGLTDAVPMGDMSKILPTVQSKKMPAIIDPQRIGELLRAIDAYNGSQIVICAAKLLPYLALRPGEFRMGRWDEIDFSRALWVLPPHHRKLKKKQQQDAKNVHLVPLSRQALGILKEVYTYTGSGIHIFPSARGDFRCMSENTMNGVLASLGFKGEMVGHGWRSAFSTHMNTQGFNPDAIERQLSHVDKNAVRAAYNRAEYLDERVKIMQVWADYLDDLKKTINKI